MSNRKKIRFFLVLASFVTSFVVAIVIFFTYRLPLYKKCNDTIISELKIKTNQLIAGHQNKIDSLNIELDKLKNNINFLYLINENLADKNEGYKKLLNYSKSPTLYSQLLPIGYSNILPGMKLSDVKNEYSQDIIDVSPEGNAIIVNVKNSQISYIAYSSEDGDFSGLITSMLVSNYDLDTLYNSNVINNSTDKQTILNFLHNNLGKEDECGAGEYIWKIDNYRYVYHNIKLPSLYSIFIKDIHAPNTSLTCLESIDLFFKGDR